MKRVRVLGGLLCALASLAGAVAAPPAHAATTPVPVRVGDLKIYKADDGSTKISHGGSSTEFVLGLPGDATCPGDSANDDWRTQGFLAPEGTDLAALTYGAVGPVGPGVFPLYEVNTRSYRHELLTPNDKIGQPGHIPGLPPMSFATYPPGFVPPGRYVIGLACTYFQKLDKFWTITVDVAKDASDSPAQLTWAVVGSGAASSSSGSSRLPLVLVLGAVLAAGAVVTVRRSKRSATPPKLAKEHS